MSMLWSLRPTKYSRPARAEPRRAASRVLWAYQPRDKRSLSASLRQTEPGPAQQLTDHRLKRFVSTTVSLAGYNLMTNSPAVTLALDTTSVPEQEGVDGSGGLLP